MKNRYAAVIIAALLLAGCASAPPYPANTAVVSQMGEEAALEKLKKILKQAAAPQVTPNSVDVTSEYYFYQALDIAMYGRGFVSKKVFFKEVDHVEVWESRGHTYVKLVGDKKLDQLKWDSETDAKDFADLVMSFKQGGGSGGEKPATVKDKTSDSEEKPADGEKPAE